MYSSPGSTAMQLMSREFLPNEISVGRTLRATGSSSHTRIVLCPPVTMERASVECSQVMHVTESCAAGLPHSAIPVATVHTTTLLSSSLPIDARYVPHGEKASPRTPSLEVTPDWTM